ncbi:MAG TPA: DEAD/DEAH box helicase, partial [Xanthobacteraceae bacterium]|nr:DEAD/DEAH box helicase [Xanthobacteraceae bacterium]
MTVLDRPILLPEPFTRWFASRGWTPRAHQLELLAKAQAGRSVLLIAPTGGGKTLAGFLPSLVELSGVQSRSLPLARSAPSPLVGEGGGRGSRGDEKASTLAPNLPTPAPDPSPTSLHSGARERGPGGGGVEQATRRRLISTGRGIQREGGLHTLYISPLKALAVDIARNLEAPIAEMGLPIRIETRTGDTPSSKRQRQRRDPPEILL